MTSLHEGPRVPRVLFQPPSQSVGARLRWFARGWAGLGSAFCTSVASSGYVIPFHTPPVAPRGYPEFFGPKKHIPLIDEHVKELYLKGAIRPVFGAEETRAGFTSPLL